MSQTEHTPIIIQVCLRSQMGLWEKYYYTLFGITILLFGLQDWLVWMEDDATWWEAMIITRRGLLVPAIHLVLLS